MPRRRSMSDAISKMSSSLLSPEITTESSESGALVPASTAACIRRDISTCNEESSLEIDLRTWSNDMPEKCWLKKLPASMSSCSRSEEHTSELQSLMRISYAVFCLQKKT